MTKKICLGFVIVPILVLGQLQKGLQTYSVLGRDYDMTTPSDYDSSKEYPIVFELHSFNKDRTQMHDQSLVNEQQYISVRPEGKERLSIIRAWNTWEETEKWGFGDDVAYITAVYNDLQNRMGTTFNPEKVYVYGYSNGGAMAMKMVEETNLFKAAIIRSMSFVEGHTIPVAASKIPMIFIHGTHDETIPYQGGKGKYGLIAPKFESIKKTVAKWAEHSGLTQPQDIKYLKGSSPISDKDFYFREYFNTQYPIYFFVVDGAGHVTDKQFSNRNIKRAIIKLAKNPKCYGLSRALCGI